MAKKAGVPGAPNPMTRTAPATSGAIKVRATRMGYYGHIRRREGDVFAIRDERELSAEWMERVDAQTPEHVTTGKDALRRQHEEIVQAKTPGAMLNDDGDHAPTGAANVLGDD